MSNRLFARAVIPGLLAFVGMSLGCDKTSTSPSGLLPFTRPAALAVTFVSPNAAPADVGVEVRIIGTGFQPGATVRLGGAATNVTLSGSTVITATAPAHSAGTVDVVVTNPDGQSGTLPKAFTYVPLTVSAVAPKAGLAGSTVSISGTGFSSGATVTLGGIATTVTVLNSTSIRATAPVHAAGAVDVVVTNPGGHSATLTGGYTYEVVTLTVGQTLVAPGGQLSVSWVAPTGRSSFDWVGLFRVGEPNTSYLWYEYTNGATSGTVTLSAPTQPGQYEFRYLLDDGYIDVVRSGPVTVSAGGQNLRSS